jgi:hypothetical protein
VRRLSSSEVLRNFIMLLLLWLKPTVEKTAKWSALFPVVEANASLLDNEIAKTARE